MSVEQTNIVDAIGIAKQTGAAVLTISDHLAWEDETDHHLALLQEKINSYLAFIESGEIYQTYPDAQGCDIVISVVFKYPLNELARQFLDGASAVVASSGVSLQFRNIHDLD